MSVAPDHDSLSPDSLVFVFPPLAPLPHTPQQLTVRSVCVKSYSGSCSSVSDVSGVWMLGVADASGSTQKSTTPALADSPASDGLQCSIERSLVVDPAVAPQALLPSDSPLEHPRGSKEQAGLKLITRLLASLLLDGYLMDHVGRVAALVGDGVIREKHGKEHLLTVLASLRNPASEALSNAAARVPSQLHFFISKPLFSCTPNESEPWTDTENGLTSDDSRKATITAGEAAQPTTFDASAREDPQHATSTAPLPAGNDGSRAKRFRKHASPSAVDTIDCSELPLLNSVVGFSNVAASSFSCFTPQHVLGIVPDALIPLFSCTEPIIPIDVYLAQIASGSLCGYECLIMAVALVVRVARRGALPICSLSLHRVLLAAIVVSVKARADHRVSMRRIATAGGVSTEDLCRMELALCTSLGFDVCVGTSSYIDVVFSLRHHASLRAYELREVWAGEAWAALAGVLPIPSEL